MLIGEASKANHTSSPNGDATAFATLSTRKAEGGHFLKTASLKKLSNWSFSYLNRRQIRFSDSFRLVKIGTFLSRSKEAIKIQDDVIYKRVTIKLYGKGAQIRDEVAGHDIGTKNQFLVKEGHFLLSRIDARNGAFAIATREIDGAIVTNDFPVYNVDLTFINPNYFSLLIATKHFAAYFQGLSSGTTNRQRMDEAEFLEMHIPLPSLKIQAALVATYNAQMLQASEFETQAAELEQESETYLLKELGVKTQEPENKAWRKFKFLQSAKLTELSRWDIWRVNTAFNSLLYDNLCLRDVTIGEPQSAILGGEVTLLAAYTSPRRLITRPAHLDDTTPRSSD